MRRLLLALWLGLAAWPAAAQMFEPTEFRLANGLQVVVIEDRRAPVVTHMVWYRVGSADEPPGKSGIAHFLEHLMFKGTAAVPPGEFSKIVARNGGRDNAFTSYDYTAYFQTVAADRLELVMRMEADRMAGLVLTDAEVLPERDVILEERRQTTENSPRAILFEQSNAALWLNHPYGRPIIGWEHEMRGLSREDALAFYRLHYGPNNAILIVAGDVSAADVRTLAERHYGPVQPVSIPPRIRPAEPPPRAARRVVYEDVRVRQPSWSRTYLAPSLSAGAKEHAVPLSVLAEVLNGRTGRLDRALVQGEGPAIGAGAWYDDTALDGSRFVVSATPRPGVDVAKVEQAMDEQIARLLKDGVTAEEVERARAKLLAAAIYARDSAGGIARIFGTALTTGQTVQDVEDWPNRVRAVTAEQVVAAARHVLDPRRSVTAILLPKEGA